MATLDTRLARLEAKRRAATLIIVFEDETKADALARYGLATAPAEAQWILLRYDPAPPELRR